ncbi:MAG TPA: hypothetical protein V6C58_14780 [Allocoleopsis sp.]|jgi:hypothetical protein
MINKEESRLVSNARRDVLLYRILSGRLEYNDEYIREPTRKIKEKGARIYYETIKDCTDVLTDRDIFLFLVYTKQWSFDEEKKLERLPKEIENLKVDYFKNFNNPSIRRSVKIELDYKKHLYKDYYSRRNKHKNLTAEGIASGAMWFEMIRLMYNGSDILGAINYYHSNVIREEDLRDIAQSDIWLSYFTAGKNLFGKRIIDLTEDQRRLIMWSNIYRNTRSDSECPNDNVFEDHDAFDGYLLLEQRKKKNEKKIEQLAVNHKNAQNIYVMVNNDDDFHEINSLNTPEALRKIENEFKEK